MDGCSIVIQKGKPLPEHHIQCRCGNVQGRVSPKGLSNRVKCYCADCQAFAHFLGNEKDILEEQGGTEIVQLAQPCVHFDKGLEHLGIMRLSPKGLLRWHTTCCNTPIGNTLANPKTVFVGLVSNILDKKSMDADFSSKVSLVNTDAALGNPKPKSNGLMISLLKVLWLAVSHQFGKRYLQSSFFNQEGKPIVNPNVIPKEQAIALKQKVRVNQ